MANSSSLNVIIGAIDRLSGPMNRMNRTIERVRAPVDRINRATNRLGRASGMREFNRSLRTAARNAGNVRRKLSGIGKVGAAGVLTVAAGVATLASKFSSAGDNIGKTALRLGIGTTALQELRYASDRQGVSSKAFDMSLQRLIRKASETARGVGVTGEAFDALGVNVKNANGDIKDSETLMNEVLFALGKVKEKATRNDLSAKFFDSEGVALVQLAEAGEEAIRKLKKEGREIGGFLSEEDIKNSETFTDKMLNLSEAFAGLGNRLARVIVPALIPLMEKLKVLAVDLGPKISVWAKDFAKNLPGHLESLKESFNKLGDVFEKIGKVTTWVSENFGLMNTAFAVIGTLIAGSLVSALYSLVTVFIALGSAILLTPVGWIIGGLALITAGGVLLYQNWDKVTEVWTNLVKKFKEDPFKFVGNTVKGLANIVMEYNPFSVMLKSVNHLIKALTGFNVLDKIQRKLANLLPSWAIDMLGLQGSNSTLQAPISNKNTSRSEVVIKVDADGRARVKGMKTDSPSTSLTVDAGGAMNSKSSTQTYINGYAQFSPR